jgi:hypothetical protein
MLVKELRQGIQSGVFAWTFIALHVVMALLMTWAIMSLADGVGAGDVMDVVQIAFWGAVGAATAVVIPLRGLGAIASERVGSNLDLVTLTHLSATRIVVGKWIALVVQSLLLAMATLPYLVLRHFFGGLNVVGDLATFGWVLATAMLVTAAAVALSTLPRWVRIGAGVLAGAVALPLAAVVMDDVFSSGPASWSWPPFFGVGLAALIGLYTLACLLFAAARIAPAAENHAAHLRVLALAVASVWAVAGWRLDDEATVLTMVSTAPLLILVCVGALLEKPPHLASPIASWARLGPVGAIASRLLAPGWATGLLFVVTAWSLCMVGVLGLANRFAGGDWLRQHAVLGLLALATLVFPLPVVVSRFRSRMPLANYAIVQLVSLMILVWSGGPRSTDGSAPESMTWVVVMPFPLAALATFVGLRADDAWAPAFLAAALLTLAAVMAAVFRPWLRDMRAVDRLVATARGGRARR